MFINEKYLKHVYKMPELDHRKFSDNVLPDLINRLSMDRRVTAIELFTSINLSQNLGFGSKINLIESDTDNLINFAEIMERYIDKTKISDDIVVVYNPLFPFLSIEKIWDAYELVKTKKIGSAIGVDHYYQKAFSDDTAEIMDVGIFSVFRKSAFSASKSRLQRPVKSIGLNALELISLREFDDYELYGLVVNSGFIQ